MRSELDLIHEFTELHVEKVDAWGTLSESDERRYAELKGFYDHLLASRADAKVPSAERFSLSEIDRRLRDRSRLRIPAAMNVFFCHGDTYAPARSRNLSAGGAFVATEVPPDPGNPLTLYMPNLGGGYELLFETDVDVVWAKREIAELRGMGLKFTELGDDAKDQLDEFILNYLRDRLSKSNTLASRSSWVRERWAIV